jgi:hypothetical protein
MAQFGVISSRVIQEEQRWDAGFHLILERLRPRVEVLQKAITVADAQARLSSLPLPHKRCLIKLARGGTDAVSDERIDRVIKEYPHLSLALIEEQRDQLSAEVKAEIGDLQAGLDALDGLTNPSGP